MKCDFLEYDFDRPLLLSKYRIFDIEVIFACAFDTLSPLKNFRFVRTIDFSLVACFITELKNFSDRMRDIFNFLRALNLCFQQFSTRLFKYNL